MLDLVDDHQRVHIGIFIHFITLHVLMVVFLDMRIHYNMVCTVSFLRSFVNVIRYQGIAVIIFRLLLLS